MKRSIVLTAVVAAIALILSFLNRTTSEIVTSVSEASTYVLGQFDVPTLEDAGYDFPMGYNSPEVGDSYSGFKEALAFSESSGNYFAVNRLGYRGRYQFGASALKWVGVTSKSQFLRDPWLQERALDALVAKNKFVLRNYIPTYVGKTLGGVEITESGLIAAAHLVGAGNVKKFLDTQGEFVFADANGVPVTTYLNKFKNFDTSVIPADARATV